MPLNFDLTVTLPFPAAPFWAQRASRPFLDFLVSDGALRRAAASAASPVPPSEAAALTTATGSPFRRGAPLATRTQSYIPASADIPDALRLVLGEELFGLEDTQVWEAAAGDGSTAGGGVVGVGVGGVGDGGLPPPPMVQTFRITPAVLSAYVTTGGVLTVASVAGDADGAASHRLTGSVGVSLWGLADVAEAAVLRNMDTFYAAYPATVGRWRLGGGGGRAGDAGVQVVSW
ncbi:hypothetical protein MMPV_005581 [Pyropia vietnamensis]